METFFVMGLQFSIVATVALVVAFYLILASALTLWSLARLLSHSLRQGRNSLAIYRDKTTQVLQTSSVQTHKTLHG